MDKNKQMIIMSAIPRSGKSTYVESKRKQGYIVLSADDLRIFLLGEKGNMEHESLIWKVLYDNLEEVCNRGYNVIIDNTNISRKARKTLINIGKKFEYNIIATVINTKLETILRRCDKSNFPKNVVYNMLERYQRPSYDEGFTNIIYVDGE